MVTFLILVLSNRGLSQSLMQASSLRGRLVWFQESRGRLCVWSKEHLEESNVFFAAIGVFDGLTSAFVRMHWKRASRSWFVKDVASWLRRWAVSRTRFKSSSIAREVSLERSSSDEDEVSLAQKERCADFPEVSLQLLDPSEWRLTVYGGFFRDENTITLEARFILYAVRHAESCHPPGRFMIFSDNLALVPALCKGRSNMFTLLSVMRRIFASDFRAGFVLSFSWIPSELNCSDRFLDSDYGPGKSLLHASCTALTTDSTGTDLRPGLLLSLTHALGCW